MKRILIAVSIVLCSLAQANAAVVIKNLQVEYRNTPLGIDVAQPRFSWQMATTAGERGYAQTAYQIDVKDPKGAVVWDSKRTETPHSLAIKYAGSPLKAATRYSWAVTVWNQAGAQLAASSWFETGLMDPAPDSSAWGGAKWIGGGNDDLVLYSPYLAIFDVGYALRITPGSTRASFVYGANDSRLMDKYKNIYQVENGKDQSYIKLELDISGVDGTPDGKAKLHVYRAGYKDTDDPSRPLRTFDISTEVINNANKNAEHVIEFRSTFGQIAISIDGNASFMGATAPAPAGGRGGFGGRGGGANAVNLNPVGSGGNYISFGMLCDIGFSVGPGQNASFRDVTVRNNRSPNNILFRENLTGAYHGIYADLVTPDSGFSLADGRYLLAGGSKGVFLAGTRAGNRPRCCAPPSRRPRPSKMLASTSPREAFTRYS